MLERGISSLLFYVVFESKDFGDVKDLADTYFLNIETGMMGEAIIFESYLFDTVIEYFRASSLRFIWPPLIIPFDAYLLFSYGLIVAIFRFAFFNSPDPLTVPEPNVAICRFIAYSFLIFSNLPSLLNLNSIMSL